MNFIAWITFGILAGVIATLLEKESSGEKLTGAVVLGISGSVVGGIMANTIMGGSIVGFNMQSFFVAILGALVLLYLGQTERRT